jgi:DNA-binding LacI/PurR family transcriptional regulator
LRQLTAIVRQARPGERLPTTGELCERLNISVVTLNNALKTLEGRGLIVRRSGIGLFAADTLHQRRIALLCGAHFFGQAGVSPFWQTLLETMRERAAMERECIELLLVPFAGDGHAQILPAGLADSLRAGDFDGILTIGIVFNLSEWLDTLPIPRVSFAGPGPDIVSVSPLETITRGVPELAARGCRRIACWSPIAPYRPVGYAHFQPNPTREAFENALTEAGLPFDAALFQDNRDLVDFVGGRTTLTHAEQGYRQAARTFGPAAAAAPPDGILSTDDMLTTGVLSYLRQNGIPVATKPGVGVQIATHANRGSATLLGWENELTRIEYDPAEMVEALFALLHARLSGTPPAGRHLIQPRVIPIMAQR